MVTVDPMTTVAFQLPGPHDFRRGGAPPAVAGGSDPLSPPDLMSPPCNLERPVPVEGAIITPALPRPARDLGDPD
jgi:hypothetical protein